MYAQMTGRPGHNVPTLREMSEEQAPYGGAPSGTAAQSLKKVRTRHFQRAKENGIKITGLTSYDYLSACIFDEAGIDFLLVGDSAGNTVFGYDTTIPVTVDELIPLAAPWSAVRRALVIADMPFGSYENGPDEALHTAIRFMKETGAHAVKLEGGVRSAKQIKRIVRAGIPVMAHIGFTPQSEHGLGGHIIQGRGEGAEQLLDDAHAVEEAGAFAVVLEMVPSEIAGRSPPSCRSRRSRSVPGRTATASCSCGATGPGSPAAASRSSSSSTPTSARPCSTRRQPTARTSSRASTPRPSTSTASSPPRPAS